MKRVSVLALGLVSFSSFAFSSFAFSSFALVGSARAADPAPAPAAAAAPDKKIDWEHMSVPDKKKYMKTTVLPALKKDFQTYDAKTYKKFSCVTCHGDGATDGKFKMPNPKLPKLPGPTDQAGFMALHQKKPEAVKFMASVVKHDVANLLGMPEWTPETKTGFACYNCHPHE